MYNQHFKLSSKRSRISQYSSLLLTMIPFRYFIDSCYGILCIGGVYKGLVILWNPFLRKFKELSLFEKPKVSTQRRKTFGFGYDSFTDKYKVIVALHYLFIDSTSIAIIGITNLQ